MKKLLVTILIIFILASTVITLFVFSYSKTDDYATDKLPANTIINGIDCSNSTYPVAKHRLTDAWNKRSLVVTDALSHNIITYSNFNFSYDIDDYLRDIKKNNIISAALNHYIKTPFSVDIPMLVSGYDNTFKSQVLSSGFLNKDTYTVSQNAYVDLSDKNFSIVPEIFGTQPDKEKFFDNLIIAVECGNSRMIFDEKDYYTLPEITATDDNLIKYQKFCRKYLNQHITYDLGKETFTISADRLSSLLSKDLSGKADKASVEAFVRELADEYDNVGSPRSYSTPDGRTIDVKGGTYGWEIDRDAETKLLIDNINSHNDIEREPVFSSEGYGKYSRDTGDTFIEVDISAQKVRMFSKNELVFTSNCVTGCRVTGTTTSTGTYYILNKVRHAVLRGRNVDGSTYESPTSYWMGVTWSGQGFHDASWRSQFGGNIWITNGSHGCINMPLNRVSELYNKSEVGMPVVMHY